jgi:hypothetical protein
VLNLLLSYTIMGISNIPALRAREARLLLSHTRTALVTELHSRSRSSSRTTTRHHLSSFLNTRLEFQQAHRSAESKIITNYQRILITSFAREKSSSQSKNSMGVLGNNTSDKSGD